MWWWSFYSYIIFLFTYLVVIPVVVAALVFPPILKPSEFTTGGYTFFYLFKFSSRRENMRVLNNKIRGINK